MGKYLELEGTIVIDLEAIFKEVKKHERDNN